MKVLLRNLQVTKNLLINVLIIFSSSQIILRTTAQECVNGNGADYQGTMNKTKNCDDCDVWTNWGGEWSHNYCRNPDNSARPWCWSTATGNYEDCDIPSCEGTTSTTNEQHLPTLKKQQQQQQLLVLTRSDISELKQVNDQLRHMHRSLRDFRQCICGGRKHFNSGNTSISEEQQHLLHQQQEYEQQRSSTRELQKMNDILKHMHRSLKDFRACMFCGHAG